MKRIALSLAPLLLLTAPPLAPAAMAATKAAAPARIVTVTVVMQDRKFRPQVIRLRRDQPTRIVLVNRDVSGHNFSAKGFFSRADIRDSGMGLQAIHEGIVSVPSTSTRAFVVTPRVRGPFNLKSSVALDVASGMQGQILVY
jgi:plastocyanin